MLADGASVESDVDIVARTAWGEARGEGRAGMAAVINVIANRVARPSWWGKTWQSVCRAPQQFSCWNDDDPNRALIDSVDESDADFRDARALARMAIDGDLSDRTNGADHYHAAGSYAWWANGYKPVAKIGRHIFYRLNP